MNVDEDDQDEEGLINKVAPYGLGENFGNRRRRREPLLLMENENTLFPKCSTTIPARRLDFTVVQTVHHEEKGAKGNVFLTTHNLFDGDDDELVNARHKFNEEEQEVIKSDVEVGGCFAGESYATTDGCTLDEEDLYDSDQQCGVVDSTYDDNDGDFRRSKFCLFNERNQRVCFSLGVLFKDKNQFKNVARMYSLQLIRELIFFRNARTRFLVVCVASAKCPWSIHVTYCKKDRGLHVRAFNDDHQCSISFYNRMVNTKLIASWLE